MPVVTFRRRSTARSAARSNRRRRRLVPYRSRRRYRKAASMALNRKFYNFTRWVPSPSFLTTGITQTTSVSGTLVWTIPPNNFGRATFIPQIQDMPGYTEFSSLFDMYKLNAYAIDIVYRYNEAENKTGTTNIPLPYIIYAKDYDDAGVPADEATLMQYQKARKRYFGQNRRIRIFGYLRTNTVANDGVNNVGSQAPWRTRPWMDMDVASFRHFGLKLVIPNHAPAASNNIEFDISAKYYFTLKTVR